MHHPWGPGTAEITWEACECPPAQSARGGHIVVRCLATLASVPCTEEWKAPRHEPVREGPLGHHRPGYR